MQNQNLLLRNDTILGVCEAIGRDFGFHPNWLRLAFCGAFFVSPAIVAAAYVALGIPVAVARWKFPAPKPAEPIAQVDEPALAQDVEEEPQLPLAA